MIFFLKRLCYTLSSFALPQTISVFPGLMPDLNPCRPQGQWTLRTSRDDLSLYYFEGIADNISIWGINKGQVGNIMYVQRAYN